MSATPSCGNRSIVFSYHPDIDERLEQESGQINYIDFNGLSFNPLRVDGDAPGAFIDVAADLRDIFSAIFPDFGDIQAETIRSAIKQSYVDLGWTVEETHTKRLIPEFGTLFDLIRRQTRPDRGLLGLLARLTELSDYGFFRTSDGSRSVLDTNGITILRIHQSHR
jgi:DNA phosphorothioation-dependent restriction protein DptH